MNRPTAALLIASSAMVLAIERGAHADVAPPSKDEGCECNLASPAEPHSSLGWLGLCAGALLLGRRRLR